MRSSLLSALIVASTVSTALGAPTASVSFVEPSASVSQAQQAEASVDPRIEQWARMKVALPDGLFPEDRAVLEQQLKVVPMIVVEDLPQPAALARKPIDKHQRIDIEPAYKHMAIMGDNDEADFLDVVEIAPFSPEMQENLNREHEAASSNVEQSASAAASRRYRKYLGVSDNGETRIVNIPTPGDAQDINISEQQEAESSLQAKKVVGLDNQGRMRFVDVPFYNKGSQ